eukprot:4478770-Lingulodinium_polyedra.AAC.1
MHGHMRARAKIRSQFGSIHFGSSHFGSRPFGSESSRSGGGTQLGGVVARLTAPRRGSRAMAC